MTLAEKIKQGVKFTAMVQFATYGIRFGSNLILTRLLAPDLFGIMSVALMFTFAANMLCDVGLRSAIIAEKRADDIRYRDVVWTIMTLRIFAFLALVTSFSFGVDMMVQNGWVKEGSVYSDPRLKTLLFLLVISCIFNYLESIELVYLERMMQYNTMLRLELSRQVIQTGVTILWAWQSPGIVALAAGGIAANAFMAVASYVWIAKRGPRWVWSREDFHFLFSRAKWLWVSAVLTFSMTIIDRVFLASYFTATEMGLHGLAMLFGYIVVDLVQKFAGSVVFPLVSEAHRAGDKEIWKTYYKALSKIVMVALPSGFFFLTFGDLLIQFLYDPRYHRAGELLRAFGIIALLSIYTPCGDVYVALGEVKIKSFIYVVRLASLIVGLLTLVPKFGLIGGVYALILSQALGALACLFFNYRLGLFHRRTEFYILSSFGLIIAGSFAIRALIL